MNRALRWMVGISLAACVVTISSVLMMGAVLQQRTQEAQLQVEPTDGSALSALLGADAQSASITLNAALVARHAQASDCWMIINATVYNLSAFLPKHPGTAAVIVPYCGADGTRAYQTKDLSPNSKHSIAADQLLAAYAIGPLNSVIQNTNTNIATAAPSASPSPIATLGNTLPSPVPTPNQTSGNSNTTLTNATVAAHNTSSNCWLIISGSVYDVSSYLVQHPGGVAVVTPYCGKEATNAFMTKGGNSGSHSTYASSLLGQYFLGKLGAATSATNSSTGSTTSTGSTSSTAPAQTTPPASSPSPAPAAGGQQLTSSTIAAHNTSSNCWLIISGSVYDVSSYLVQHPGGVAVVTPYCGKEATNAFQTRGGSGSHSSGAYNKLSQYLIGVVGGTTSTAPTPTPASGGSGSSAGTGSTGSIPTAVLNKYPNASVDESHYEDNGSWEGKIYANGQCREIKVNSSGSITSDHSC